jgi:hypothetical protein
MAGVAEAFAGFEAVALKLDPRELKRPDTGSADNAATNLRRDIMLPFLRDTRKCRT